MAAVPGVGIPTLGGFPPCVGQDLWADFVRSNNDDGGFFLVVDFASVNGSIKACEGFHGLKRFYGLGEHVFLIVIVAPTLRDPECVRGKNNDAVVIPAFGGATASQVQTIKVSEYYKQALDGLKADYVVMLQQSVVEGRRSENAKRRALEQNTQWLQIGVDVAGKRSENAKLLCSTIAGDTGDDELIKNFHGYALMHAGFISAPERIKQLASLNTDKLVFVNLGSDGPFQVLEAFSNGADVVYTTYPYLMASLGYASTIWTGGEPTDKRSLKINLWNDRFAKDKSVIVDGCKCYTCRHHTRAYLNHLINCREMLFESLVFIHNMQQLLDLTKAVRMKRKADVLKAFLDRFKEIHSF